MIFFKNRIAKLLGLALLAVLGINQTLMAQTPVTTRQTPIITPKTNVVLKLDKSGYRANLASEVATAVNPDGSKPTMVYISPTSFDCSRYGPQTVIITAVNYDAIRNFYVSKLSQPTDLTFDAAGNMYIADAFSYQIDKVINGGFVFYAGGTKGYQDGTGLNSAFEYITGVVSDAAGNLYVTDLNHIVRKIGIGTNPSSSRIAGTGLEAYADGKGDQASFKLMTGIALDSKGNLFVLDDGNSLIRKITPNGDVTTFAGQLGVRSYIDGNGAGATFTHMNGIYIDKADNMYIADQNKIRKVSPTGDVTTIAGIAAGGYADGPAATAKFNVVKDIVMDSGGNLFVSDYGNNRIRKITTNGIVSTFAGDGLPLFKDGLGTAASFNGPAGMTMDPVGNIYLADALNNRIRKIWPDGTVVNYIGDGTSGRDAGIINGTIFGQATVTVNVTVQADLEFAEHPDVVVKSNANCLPLLPDYTKEGNVTTCPFADVTITQLPAPGTPMLPGVPVPITLTATDQYGTAVSTSFKATYQYTPVIVPISPTPKITLNAAGSYQLKATDLANIIVCDNSTPIVKLSQTMLDCSNIGPQTITVTASNRGVTTPANARFRQPEGLAFDGAGNMYIADAGNFSIRKITPDGKVTTIAGGSQGKVDGVGLAAKFNTPVAVAVDAAGNVFVADRMNSLIRKVAPDGTVTTFAGGGTNLNGTGTAASFSVPTDLAFDNSGNLFVLDAGNNLIRKITPAGVVTTVAGQTKVSGYSDGPGAVATFTNPNGFGIDKQNYVYIADRNIVRKMDAAGVVSTIAGSPTTGGYADAQGAAARFFLTQDAVTDAAGNLFVADYQNNRIRKITPEGVVSTFAGNGNEGAVNGTGTAASFNGPRGLVMDADGNIYVTELGNNDIRKITPEGLVSTFAGDTAPGATDGDIGSETGITVTKDINIMVATTPVFAARADVFIPADLNCNASVANYLLSPKVTDICSSARLTITQVPAAGTPLTINTPVTVTLTAKDQFGGEASISFKVTAKSKPVITPLAQPITIKLNAGTYTAKLSDLASVTNCDNSTQEITISPSVIDCSKTGAQVFTITAKNNTAAASPGSASFNSPMGVATDAAGNIYIADFFNNKLRKINTIGEVSTLAGSGSPGTANGAGATASFANPRGLAVAPDGSIYVADYGNNKIRKIAPDGTVSTYLGTGAATSTDGFVSGATVNRPYKLAFDNQGNLFIADYGGNRIRKILPGGVVITFAGGTGVGGADGPGPQATFNNITGICTDVAGNVYVTDNASRIRKITPAAIVSTVAGTTTAGYRDGAVASAQFSAPAGIVADVAGNLYVADMGNNCIRKIGTDGQVSTVVKSPAVNMPTDITIDNNGDMLVVDIGFQTVIKISMDGSVSTVAGQNQPGNADGPVGNSFMTVTKQISVNVVGDINFTSVFNDVIIPTTAACPATVPDYASKATATACSSNVIITQLPVAGTPITGTNPITVTLTADDGLGNKATTSFKITPDNTSPAVPSVSITPSVTTVCDGATVTFKATPVNVPGIPVYKWLLNGNPTGTDQDTYGSSTLKDNDIVSCNVISTTGCLTTATAPGIAVKVNPNLKPDITITSTNLTVCEGSSVTFTANVTNGGASPTFQWLVNNTAIAGANNSSFTTNNRVNGDKVNCILTNNDAGCFTAKTATSPALTMVISPMVMPTVSISPSVSTPVCAGSAITFTAVPNIPNPAYQWKVNGANAGANSATFTSVSLNNGDQVTCTITAAAGCFAIPTATSNAFTANIISSVTVNPVISTANTNICAGQAVTFDVIALPANVVSGYQWQVNGQDIPTTNSASFTTGTLKDADVVTCIVSVANACLGPFKSNALTIHTPTITLNLSPAPIKKGESVTLSPTITGNIVSYQWMPATGLSDATIANPVARPEVTTTYQLTVTSATGCVTTGQVTLTVTGTGTGSGGDVLSSTEITNSFTPNGDGVNDLWKIGALANYPNNVVDIFDRSGRVVFHSNGYSVPWDGIFKGSNLPAGVYFYVIDLKAGAKPVSGTVTIIR